ncbi:Uncharacterised protein [Mycobacterium tuberculosis]|nr:Uncharacterised protein [Mycobacterium tuberculosis]
MTSPSNVSSPTGAPSTPPELPSRSQAALRAPRTTKAPWSGVQKITGLSLAEKVAARLSGPARPGTSLMVGHPRSLLAAPPSDSYLSRIGPYMNLAPVSVV